MTTLTAQQLAALTSSSGSTSGDTNTNITADYFIGDLLGNASTATKLEKEVKLTLTGDATGSVSSNGSADKTLSVHVTKAEHAETADYAGHVTLASRATLADLANLATYALEAGKLRTFKITFTGDILTGEGELGTDGHSVAVTIDAVNINKGSIVFLANAGTSLSTLNKGKLYIDLTNNEMWVYNYEANEWKNLFAVIKSHFATLDSQIVQINSSITTINTHLTTLDTTVQSLQAQITSNDTDIAGINSRLGLLSDDYEIEFQGNTYKVGS